MFAALVATLPLSVTAQDIEKRILSEMELAPTPLRGVASAMVAGSFAQAGAFAGNAIMSEGSLFPPHAHPDARISVVLDGVMYLGAGDVVDPSVEQAFEAGSVAVTPAGTTHWMAARDGDVRILEIGTGPTETRWAEPQRTQ